jgi:hypothetical protein
VIGLQSEASEHGQSTRTGLIVVLLGARNPAVHNPNGDPGRVRLERARPFVGHLPVETVVALTFGLGVELPIGRK